MINLKKPTVVVIESSVNSGAEYALDIVQHHLQHLYNDKYQHIKCNGLFEIEATRDNRCLRHVDDVLTYNTETFTDPHNEVGGRLWSLESVIEAKKSFAFVLLPGMFNKTAHDLLDTLKSKYNVVRINVYTNNILEHVANIPLSEIDHHVMFSYFKQSYSSHLDSAESPRISHDEIKENPFALIELFSNVDVGVSVTSEPKEFSGVSPMVYSKVQTLLNTYNIKHILGNSNGPILVEPFTKAFEINEDIPGWTSFDKLYYLAVVTRFLGPNTNIVELGCWAGRSSYVIANNRMYDSVNLKCYDFFPKKGPLLSETMIDYPFVGKFRKTDRYGMKLFKKHFGNPFNSEIFNGDLVPQIKELDNNSVHMLFADAGHTYESTKEYLNIMHDKLVPGAIIVVDDYDVTHFADASKAVDDYAEERGLFINNGSRYGCEDFAIIIKK